MELQCAFLYFYLFFILMLTFVFHFSIFPIFIFVFTLYPFFSFVISHFFNLPLFVSLLLVQYVLKGVVKTQWNLANDSSQGSRIRVRALA